MADEVNWGRVRPWDGAKGCPPVAEDKPCAAFEWEWVGLDYPALGVEWMWESDTTAYRIPAEFDHLDDYGAYMTRWSDVFKPVDEGVGPEGVSIETHEIQYTSDGFHWVKPASYVKWNISCGYRYRPLQTPDLNGNPADPLAGYTSAELRAAADAKDDDLGEWLELLAKVYDESFLPKVAEDVRDKSFGSVYGDAARILCNGAKQILGVTL